MPKAMPALLLSLQISIVMLGTKLGLYIPKYHTEVLKFYDDLDSIHGIVISVISHKGTLLL